MIHSRITCSAPLAALAALLAAGCGGASTSSAPSSGATTDLQAAIASASEATGTLLCAPSQTQIDACAAASAGGACTYAATDGQTVNGTCRTTVDGSSLACAPNPHGPPPALVDACAGKATGDACNAVEPDGETHDGLCMTARDGTTLVCGRVHTPPQAAIDACANLTAGATCSMPAHDGMMSGTGHGVCSLGPASTGPLACSPPQELRPSATTSCAGLAVGASCVMGGGRHESFTGTCVTPGGGGNVVCVAACNAIGGPFHCGPAGDGAGMMPGMSGMGGSGPFHH